MIAYLITVIIIYIAYKIYDLTRCPKGIEHIPALPILTFFKFNLSKQSYTEKMKEEFQPMFNQYGMLRVFTNFGWTVYFGDSKLCKEVTTKHDIFIKNNFTQIPVSEHLVNFFGRSQILSSCGSEWRRHRKVINPIFNQSWSTELFGECVRDVIDEWEKKAGGEVKIHDTIQRMTFDVFGKSIFDIDFNTVKDKASYLYNLFNSITDQCLGQTLYLVLPFMEHVPYFRRPKLAQQLNEYHKFIENMVASRKTQYLEGTGKSKDLITAFIESNEKEDESKLTNDEIRDNITNFILAGHDTTSNTLVTTLYYLARYPEIQDRLHKEILEALDHPSKLIIPTINQLKRIPYMDLVNKESMRIMTTASVIQRVTAQTHTLSNGVTIPKGTQVSIHLWGAHYNSNDFRNPEDFNPDRFSDLSSEESRSWQPFTTGPRSCPGMTFSLIEQRVTIAMLLQKFEFSITKDNSNYEKLKIDSSALVRPIDLSLIVKLRS